MNLRSGKDVAGFFHRWCLGGNCQRRVHECSMIQCRFASEFTHRDMMAVSLEPEEAAATCVRHELTGACIKLIARSRGTEHSGLCFNCRQSQSGILRRNGSAADGIERCECD